MISAGHIIGSAPGWLDLGPIQEINGLKVREVLGDFSHLYEDDRPPKYVFNDAYVANNFEGFDRSETRSYVKQTRAGKPIAELKGRHSGRVAILFNGPSMSNHDLHKIKVPIIGMNRTHVGWPSYKGPQPDYLCVVDWAWLDQPKWAATLRAHPCIVNGSDHKAEVGYRVTRHPRMDPFSFDLERDGYVGPVPCTTGHLALQLAVYLGFTELYCIGLDMGGRHFDGSGGSLFYRDAIRQHKRQAPLLKERGIEMYVCGSPQSALVGYEHRTFEDLAC